MLWLVPLGVPFLRELFAHGPAALKAATAIVAIASATISTFIFHPKHPDNYREPTWLATLMWTRYPAWTNPMPEIFVDVNRPARRRAAADRHGRLHESPADRSRREPGHVADPVLSGRRARRMPNAGRALLRQRGADRAISFRPTADVLESVQVRPRPDLATVHGTRGAAGHGRRRAGPRRDARTMLLARRCGSASASIRVHARRRRIASYRDRRHTRRRTAGAAAPPQDVRGVHRPGDGRESRRRRSTGSPTSCGTCRYLRGNAALLLVLRAT